MDAECFGEVGDFASNLGESFVDDLAGDSQLDKCELDGWLGEISDV